MPYVNMNGEYEKKKDSFEKCAGLHEPLPLPEREKGCVDWMTMKDFKAFKLGKNTTEKNCKRAANTLLAREFPYLAASEDEDENKDDHVNYVPPNFHQVLPEVVERDSEKWSEHQKESKLPKNEKPLKDVQQTIEGDELEQNMHEQLRSLLEGLSRKNVFVFHGVNLKWISSDEEGMSKPEKGEFDFFILSKELKMVIYIECKKGFSYSNLRKAQRQFDKAYNFFQNNMPYGKDWQFARTIAFSSPLPGDFCRSCQTYMIWPSEKRLKDWWQKLEESSQASAQPSNSCTRKEFANLVKNILFFALMQWEVNLVSRLESSRKIVSSIESRSTKDNILFWTNQQTQELYNQSKILLFDSDFGTGKTELLKAKAKYIRQTDYEEKVRFYVYDAHHLHLFREKEPVTWKPSLLYLALQNELSPHGIEVMAFSLLPFDCENSCRKKLAYLCHECHKSLLDNVLSDLDQGYNVFIDEFTSYRYPYQDIINHNTEKILQSGKYLWIALDYGQISKPKFEDGQNIQRVELQRNLRNADEVTKYGWDSLSTVVDSHCISVWYKGYNPSRDYHPGETHSSVEMVKHLSKETSGDIAVLFEDMAPECRCTIVNDLVKADYDVYVYTVFKVDEDIPHAKHDVTHFLEKRKKNSRQRVLFTQDCLFHGCEVEAVVICMGPIYELPFRPDLRRSFFRGVSYLVRHDEGPIEAKVWEHMKRLPQRYIEDS